MDWSNERYVRLYTRDTTAMRAMPWQSRCLFWELVRKVDRAGVMDLDGLGVEGLAINLMCPTDVAEAALGDWMRFNWVEQKGDLLVIPSHLEAQEAASTDAQRKRRQREVRLAKARDADILNDSDDESQGVTGAHSESRSSQPNPTQPNPSQPCLKSAPPKAKRGHRLPSDWSVSEALYDYAAAADTVDYPRREVDRCAEAFRDHWHTSTGRNATKLSWDTAFKTWLRTDRERKPNAPRASTQAKLSRSPPPADHVGKELAKPGGAASPEQLAQLQKLLSETGRSDAVS